MIIFFILLVFSVVFWSAPRPQKPFRRMREPRLDYRLPPCDPVGVRGLVHLPGDQRIHDFAAPGDQLRTTSLAIIPDNWTLDSYRSCSPSSRSAWMGNSLLVSGLVTLTGVALAALGGYAFSRFEFVGKKSSMLAILTTQMFPATMLLLPLYILIARLHLVNTFLGLMIFYTATALPFCLWQMKGFLRHDSGLAGRSGLYRRLHALVNVLSRHAAAGRAGPGHHSSVQLHDGLVRIHRGRPGAAGARYVHIAAGTEKLPGQHVNAMGTLRRLVRAGQLAGGVRVHLAQPLSGQRVDAGIGQRMSWHHWSP